MKSIIFTLILMGSLLLNSCDSVNIYGVWEIDEIAISGYDESEAALYDELEQSLKGGRIEFHLDGSIDTYSFIDGKESIVTKTFDYNGSDELCIYNEDNAKNCMNVIEWTDDVMKSETKDGDLTVKMTFKRVK